MRVDVGFTLSLLPYNVIAPVSISIDTGFELTNTCTFDDLAFDFN